MAEETYTPRLKTKYREEIKGQLLKEFKHQNVNQVGGLEKIVVNMGVGAAAHDHKLMEGAISDLSLSLIHISEPTRREWLSRMPSSA